MSVVLGNDVNLYIYDGGMWKIFACGRECEFSLSTEMLETSQPGTGSFATFLPSKHSAEASVNGVVVLYKNNTLSLSDLRAYQIAKTALLMRFVRQDTTGLHYYQDECMCYIKQSTDTGTYQDVATFSITLQPTGTITQIYTPTPTTFNKMKRLEYTGIGGEYSFTDAALVNKDVQIVTRDGIAYSKLITAGTPIDKEVKYVAAAGSIEFSSSLPPLAAGEEVVVSYQDL